MGIFKSSLSEHTRADLGGGGRGSVPPPFFSKWYPPPLNAHKISVMDRGNGHEYLNHLYQKIDVCNGP